MSQAPRRSFLRTLGEVSSQVRLDEDRGLQELFEHLWHCGPAATGLAFAALFDEIDVSSRAFDRLHGWRKFDPTSFAWAFPPLPGERRKPVLPVSYLRLVPQREPEE